MNTSDPQACVYVRNDELNQQISTILQDLGFSLFYADGLQDLEQQVKSDFFVMVFLEDRLIDKSNKLLDWFYQQSPATQVCMLGEDTSPDQALEWINHGGFGYYSRPLPAQSIARKIKSLTRLSENQWFLLETHQQLTEKLREDKERVEQEARRDGLTELANKKYFEQNGQKLLEKGRMSNSPVGFLFMDVDHFKTYNDSQGHPAGDRILKQVADLIRQEIRSSDFPGRVGGEEFAVVLPHTDQLGCYKTAERIRKSVANHPFSGEDCLPGDRLTISLGTASFPEHGEKFSQLIDVADQAAYQSKRQGRNQTTRTRTKTFRYEHPDSDPPSSVSLVGDFNGWRPDRSPMDRQDYDVWELTVPVPEGPLRYGYSPEEGTIVPDPDSPEYAEGPRGARVSKTVVK